MWVPCLPIGKGVDKGVGSINIKNLSHSYRWALVFLISVALHVATSCRILTGNLLGACIYIIVLLLVSKLFTKETN